ncbi:CinA family protein [Lachancea thermotolerans CBS 6340]|uniref:KLTH0D15510p n=1 Tax=Lachancea thermotolerans (strain ATCC 56472 / CBS 6340 / NRRL Y-8284) TaxID=559295 RepID=C5DFJ1_LACTC|nr:KLTH0D15510p [Lachancea thermotolerans CBS 6340]CAR22946.1 KLTH0D15510p [Lachancea thermotolerans CBS 6340]
MTAEFPPLEASKIVSRISQILIQRNETIAVSEAACGGLLSSYLVSVPGASQWFHGGTLVYSLKSRLKLSGWNELDIHNYTGPSVDVALRLARNLKFELGATYTLSETGYASRSANLKLPGKEQTVGVVCYGVSGPKEDVSATHDTGSEDRCYNMQQFAIHGLKFLLQQLEKQGEDEPQTKRARVEENSESSSRGDSGTKKSPKP